MSKKIKIIERSGSQLNRLLTKSDPWGAEDCKRESCKVFNQEDTETPYKRRTNLTYKSSCRLCPKLGMQAAYWGETSCSLHERYGGQWHVKDSH